MAKKATNMEGSVTEDPTNEPLPGFDFPIDTDFNLNEEYKPEPLIPNGIYFANLGKVTYDKEAYCLIFEWILDGNGGVKNDGETPVDGSWAWSRLWFPKPNDENEMTKDGKQNKRQSKINMMKRFGERLGIDLNTPRVIAEALAYNSWVGIRAKITIGIKEYQGNYSNEVGKVELA